MARSAPRGRRKAIALPRELAPAYERIAAEPEVKGLLEELRRVNEGRSTRQLGEDVMKEPPLFTYLNEEEMDRFIDASRKEEEEPGAFETKRLLQKFGRALSQGLDKEVFSVPWRGDPDFEGFKKEFGHVPANTAHHQAVPHCASNALAVALLGEHAGLKTGVLDLPEHAVPVVKLEGKNYVIEKKLYGRPNALTVREYLSELAKAHSDPEHALHKIARASFKEGKPKAADFASKMRYYGGAKSGEAIAHFNLGWSYLPSKPNKAREHLEESVRLMPTPMAHSALARALEYKNHPRLALKQVLAAHELKPRDENILFHARRLAGRLGWTKRAKELHDRAYEIISKKN